MAIINSLAIGKSVKSAGNLTYKTVRGRTIASQRITSNKSNTILQSAQRARFSSSSQAMTLVAPYINGCYEKSKYGSARNAFFKENPNFNLGGLVGEIKEGITSIADGFLSSLQNSMDNKSRINLVSKGSLAAIITGATKVVASYTYKENPYVNITAWNDNVDGFSVQFSTPINYKSVKILAFGFGTNGLTSCVGSIPSDFIPNINWEGDSDLQSAVLSCGYSGDVTTGLVNSVKCVGNAGNVSNPDYGCIIVIPIVNGKTITTSAVFLPTIS